MPVVTKEQFLAASLDYLIVGGGTSGLTLASRLSESPEIVVGVVEAGGYHANDPLVDIPGMMGRVLSNPKYDWCFQSEPQTFANGQTVPQAQGKGLGGSSLLNFFAYVRPSKADLDAWSVLGNDGWDWDNLVAYMKKSEHLQPVKTPKDEAIRNAANSNPAIHGTDGPIAKSFPGHLTRLHTEFLDTLETLGLPRNQDNSDGHPVGSILFPTSIDQDTATRSYSASAYYKPHAERPNLLVLLNARATEAEEGHCVAKGVRVSVDGDTFDVSTTKEVILAAGAMQTPQLLELSGIGQKRVVEALGQKSLVDLPGVGENLQDHGQVTLIVEVDDTLETLEVLQNPVKLKEHEDLYKQQKGIFAGIPSSTFAFLPATSFADEATIASWKGNANVQSCGGTLDHVDDTVKAGYAKQYELLKQWIADPEQPMAQILTINGHRPLPGMTIDGNKRFATILCAYTHPFARGSIHAKSADINDQPAIQPNYLSNPVDMDILVKFFRFVLGTVCETSPLKDSIRRRVLPSFGADADEETVRQYVRETIMTVNHPACTAAMAPREHGGVVDAKLRVYGTTNLRIVDCSIMPMQICANIQTVAYAIGEKAADIIVESRNEKD